MIIIVRELEIDLSNVKTDSDIEDIAEKYCIPFNEIFSAIHELSVKGTSCEGCRYIGFRFSLSPCSSCSRNPEIKDYFEHKK